MDRHFKRLRPLPGEDGSGCYWIGSAILGGSQLLGGLFGSDAAEDAAQIGAEAAREALDFRKDVYRDVRADTAPYRTAGREGLNRLSYMLGTAEAPETPDAAYGSLMRDFTAEDFEADPGYAFRRDEGEKAINRAAAARGRWGTPATVKELGRFNQGLASRAYGDAFNRWNLQRGNQFNRLASLSGIGQTAVGQTIPAANQFAAGGAGDIMAGGNALASGRLNSANALIQGFTGGAASALDAYNLNRLIGAYSGGRGA